MTWTSWRASARRSTQPATSTRPTFYPPKNPAMAWLPEVRRNSASLRACGCECQRHTLARRPVAVRPLRPVSAELSYLSANRLRSRVAARPHPPDRGAERRPRHRQRRLPTASRALPRLPQLRERVPEWRALRPHHGSWARPAVRARVIVGGRAVVPA